MIAQKNGLSRSFYDQCWRKEFTPPYLDSLLPAFEKLGIVPDSKVLDIGCGNGVLGELLQQKYHCQMYGTDISEAGLRAANARGYIVESAAFDPSGSLQRPFSGVQFDVVILSAVLEHVFDPAALLRTAYLALKDGGYVVALTPNISWFLNRVLFLLGIWDHPLMGGTPGHIRYLNKRMLENLLVDTGFAEFDWSFSPMTVLPANHDLFVGNHRLSFIRGLVGKRVRRWQSLLAENFIVLARKPTSTSESERGQPKLVDRLRGLRVLHIAATASGASWMVDILRGLRSRGYEVSALISGTRGDLATKLESAGIPYYVADLDLFSSPLTAALKLLRLARFLRKHRFDIVHYHLFASVISGRIASWLADVPLRYSMITGPYHLEAPAPSKIDRRTLWMDTKVIASCEYTRKLYCKMGVPWRRIERIYYGADESRFNPANVNALKLRRELGIKRGDSVVGMIAYFYAPLPSGSWTPRHLQGRAVKGHEILIQAARSIVEKYPKVKILLVGGGWGTVGEDYQRCLEENVKELLLSDKVIFTGPRADIPDVLASFDVSVQCSLNENLGGTIESLLMARPTVATAVGGMIDSVRHEQTGLLVPPDDPEGLSEAILELLGNPEKARQLGQNGRQLMLQEFTLTKTVDAIDRLYQLSAQEALKNRRCSSGPLDTHHYRRSRNLLNLCALSVVLPIAFRSIIAEVLLGVFMTLVAMVVALPIWVFMKLTIRYDRQAFRLLSLRLTERFERILIHAHAGCLDFTGLRKNLAEVVGKVD